MGQALEVAEYDRRPILLREPIEFFVKNRGELFSISLSSVTREADQSDFSSEIGFLLARKNLCRKGPSKLSCAGLARLPGLCVNHGLCS